MAKASLAAVAAAGVVGTERAVAAEDGMSLAAWGSFHVGGGSVDVIDLPAHGIKGNSHMMLMDHNNEQLAAVVQDWLAQRLSGADVPRLWPVDEPAIAGVWHVPRNDLRCFVTFMD